jgi:hypothetical protein
MMDMVDADIGGEPAQDPRQVIVRAAMEGAGVEVPLASLGPMGLLELVLDEEEPDADRTGDEGDRELHQKERADADGPDQ